MKKSDFEKMLNKYDLIPMEILIDTFTPYNKGDIAGFDLETAMRGYDQESLGIPGKTKPTGSKIKPEDGAGNGEKTDEEVENERLDAIEIHDNWETGAFLKRSAVAAKILNKPQKEVGGDDVVRETISAELKRRETAKAGALNVDGVVTSGETRPTT